MVNEANSTRQERSKMRTGDRRYLTMLSFTGWRASLSCRPVLCQRMAWCNATLFGLRGLGGLIGPQVPHVRLAVHPPPKSSQRLCARVGEYEDTAVPTCRVCSVRRYDGRYEGTEGVRLGGTLRSTDLPTTHSHPSLLSVSTLYCPLCFSFLCCWTLWPPAGSSQRILPVSPMGPQCTILFLILGGRH